MIWAQNHEQVEIPRIFLKNRQLGFLYLRGTPYPNLGRVLPDDWGRGWGGGVKNPPLQINISEVKIWSEMDTD